MPKISRDDIHFINKHSDWSAGVLSGVLGRHIYPDAQRWKWFLRLIFICLGVGFTTAGILFFFAYNWNGLHKFLKLGIAELLILCSLLFSMLPGLKEDTRKIIATAAPVLVGALFLVFGQIYQTASLEFDFLLQWALFVTVWVLVSDFAPLWLLYLILVHVAIVFYFDQIYKNGSSSTIFILLSSLDFSIYLLCTVLQKWKEARIPNWFMQSVAGGAVAFATMGVSIGVHRTVDAAFVILCVITLVAFATGLWYGMLKKSSFLLAIIPLGLIIIISAVLRKIADSQLMMLTTGLFIVLSVSAVIRFLVLLHKTDENG